MLRKLFGEVAVLGLLIGGLGSGCGGDSNGNGGGGGMGGVPPGLGTGGVPVGGASGTGGTGATAQACSVVGPEVRLSEADGESVMAAVIAEGNGYRVAWSDARGGAADVFTVLVDANGAKAGAEAAFTSTPAVSNRPGLLATGAGALAAWEEIGGAGEVSVVAGRAGAAPSTLAGGGVEQARPALATLGGQVYATWMILQAGGGGSVSVARLGGDGALQGAPVQLGAGQQVRYPAIAAGANGLAVAYVVGNLGATAQLKVALLDGGLGVQREVVVREGAGIAANPSVAWDGQRWVVAWEDTGRGGMEEVFFTRIDAGGTVEPSRALSVPEEGSANWPHLAVGAGGEVAVAYYAFPDDAEIMVARVGANGNRVGAPVRVSRSSGKARFPSTAFQQASGEFGIAWHDTRAGSANPEVFFARVRCAP